MLISMVLVACNTNEPIAMVTPIIQSVDIQATEYIGPTPVPVTVEASIQTDEAALPPAHTFPTPEIKERPRGEALAEAYADDLKWEFEPIEPVELGDEPVTLLFDEFFIDYDPFSYDPPEPSDKILALDGKRVVMEGYMAPPLKLGLDWFVLSKVPLGGCPFCSGAQDWIPDIVLVYIDGEEIPHDYTPLRIEGELHVGPSVDMETGMVSLVRIYTTNKDVEQIETQ